MNDLIKIQPHNIGGQVIETVNARELHAFLESRQDFSTWIKNRIEQYGFVEGVDFVSMEADFALGCKKPPWIGMKTVSNELVPWQASQASQASQADMLAEDWRIVE